ncbi:MAG: lactate utilization protein LutB domain-containing protein, partial [Planctomyces sp.]
VKIPLHHQLFAMRERLDQQQLIGTGKKLQMKALSVVLSNTWLYSLVGKVARVAMRVLPKFLIQNPLTPAGQWARQRELPEAPAKSFRQLYAERQQPGKHSSPDGH